MSLVHGSDANDVLRKILTDTAGRLIIVMRGADSPVRKYIALANTDETTIWDPTSGTKWVVTDVVCAATANAGITFRDGTAGSTCLVFTVLANTTLPINFQTPLVSTTADNILTAQTSAATVAITVSGYEL